MDPNPKSFPLLSYVLSRLPPLVLGPSSDSDTAEVDVEQQHPILVPPCSGGSSTVEGSSFSHTLVERMPHLTDPKVIASMTLAVSDVAQARSVIQTLGERPDHETVDIARTKMKEIRARLSKELEDIVRSPRPADVNRLGWRAQQSEKEQECRRNAEKEKQMYKAVVQMDEMHDGYEKLLREAEEKLVKIYETTAVGEPVDVGIASAVDNDEINEEVVGILHKASCDGIERVDLAKRQLRFLPEAFGHLRGLVVLNLSSNLLQGIPDSIAGLDNLEELGLSSNILESLPDSIGMLLKLKILNVSKNKLTFLPDTICHCRSLVELDVSYNVLTYLPTNMGYELANLQRLSIHLNKIRSLPTSVCEMRSLTHLDCHFNELRGLPRAFGNLNKLEFVDLSSNFNDMTELPDSMGDLINLKDLNLSNNQIHTLPDSFGRLENLRKINLDGNPLLIPPMDVASEGTKAVKTYMAKRWIEVLLEEERRFLEEMREPHRSTGWLTRSTSWLNNAVSGLSRTFSGYVPSSSRQNRTDPFLDHQR